MVHWDVVKANPDKNWDYLQLLDNNMNIAKKKFIKEFTDKEFSKRTKKYKKSLGNFPEDVIDIILDKL